jgi:predicted short-subunit dehydrogenase-like oxidoreductase (DUF2520 family)
MEHYNVSFTGAGRVAGALCKVIHKSGFIIRQISSLDESRGRQMSDAYNAKWSSGLTFSDPTDIIIVAVPDHILKSVLLDIYCGEQTIVVHTAGSIGLEVFPSHMKRTGVFYPLQTFTKGRDIDFTGLPFFLEASDDTSLEVIKNVAEAIGGKVHYVDKEHRQMLHLAAVFVNNFTNHMMTTGFEIASRAGTSSDVFEPLIKETILKAIIDGPENSQTGPAIRNDINTISNHLDLLSFSPEIQNVYRVITQSIIKYYKKSD